MTNLVKLLKVVNNNTDERVKVGTHYNLKNFEEVTIKIMSRDLSKIIVVVNIYKDKKTDKYTLKGTACNKMNGYIVDKEQSFKACKNDLYKLFRKANLWA